MALKELLRISLDTEQILRKAEGKRDLVTFPSTMRGVGYVTDKQELLILSSTGGYLRISEAMLPKFIEELRWMNEEIDRRKRD